MTGPRGLKAKSSKKRDVGECVSRSSTNASRAGNDFGNRTRTTVHWWGLGKTFDVEDMRHFRLHRGVHLTFTWDDGQIKMLIANIFYGLDFFVTLLFLWPAM